METRAEITRQVINLLPENVRPNLDDVIKVWYRNIRPDGGCRLTDVGYNVFKTLDIQSWSIPLDNVKQLRVDKKLLLSLDRKITFPYYINFKEKSLELFSSKEAMLATLYGDLKKFLENYS